MRIADADEAAMTQFLEGVAGEPLTVPYQRKRVVMFDSAPCPGTDDLAFRPGYENRRINIDTLFGERHDH